MNPEDFLSKLLSSTADQSSLGPSLLRSPHAQLLQRIMSGADSSPSWETVRGQPGTWQNQLSGDIGLQGLDPGYIKDPRFNYWTHMETNPRIEGGKPLIIFSPPGNRDPMDTKPAGSPSKLGVDLSDQELAKSLSYTGPNPDLLREAKRIQGKSKTFTPAMSPALRK